jgi:hypothetical protein
MARSSSFRRGNYGNNGDDTDGSINRRMRDLGKSGQESDDLDLEDTRDRNGQRPTDLKSLI